MADDDIIKRRLLIDGDGTGEGRMMTKFMKSFMKWCSPEESSIDNYVQCDRLLLQLSSIESSSLKWSNIMKMNEDEVSQYNVLREETNCDVESAAKSINSTKDDLKEARQVRCNRMEYDALARLIKEHPPRSDTANKLKLLNQELNSLKNKRDQLEQRLNLRRKQLHVLVTTLHQLQETLNDDVNEINEEKRGNSSEIHLTDEIMEVTTS